MHKTIDEIKENLVFAAEVMRRLPTVKVRGYFCAWPKFCSDNDVFSGDSDVWMPPLPHEVEAMEVILEWLKLTSVENRQIIWVRSCGMGWKNIATKCGKSRSSIIRLYNLGLQEIQNALKNNENAKNLHFQLEHAG